MNSETYRDVQAEVTDLISKELPSARRSIVDKAIGETLAKMVESGRAHLVSDEEERLLKAFRRFKIGCKPGAVFKWQTHPEAGVIIVQETGLISDPQEVA